MRMSGSGFVLVAAIGLANPACNRVHAPDVVLTGVRFAGIGLQGITLMTDLSIDNPNKFAIEADSITFQMEAANPDQAGAWSLVTRGTNRERIRVEGGDTAAAAVAIEFAFKDLGAPARSAINRGTLDYRVSGRVWVRRPLRVPVPFSHTGRLSLTGGP